MTHRRVVGCAIAVCLHAARAGAQTMTLSGRVTSASGQPIGGASVGVRELGVGVVTNAEGRYALTLNVSPNRQIAVLARYIGYKPQRFRLDADQRAVEHTFVLERDVLNLESVVVTGTSAATSQRMTPFSVSVVDNTVMADVPAASPLGALAGKVAGAAFVTLSGQPGSSPAMRLRSATSLVSNSQPLVIIDGIISRLELADINAEDIERIEVIKGAAASSLYGSDAANGVVQIFTKRGSALAEGEMAFAGRLEYGRNDLPKVIHGNMRHNYKVLCGLQPCTASDASSNKVTDFDRNTNGSRVSEDDLIADNMYPVYYDQIKAVFRASEFLTSYASLGQRRGPSNFNVSFQNTHDAGVLRLLQGFRRENVRLNVDQAVGDKLDVGTGAFYARSTADQGEEYGSFFNIRYLEPNTHLDSIAVDCPPNFAECPWIGAYNPVVKQPPLSGNGSNPLYVSQQASVTNDRDRFSGTFRTSYRPATGVALETNAGYDESNRAYKVFVPVGFAGPAGLVSEGSLQRRDDANRAYNINLTLSVARQLRENARTSSKLAYIYEDQSVAFIDVNASALSIPRVPEFTAVNPSATVTANSRTETIRARNAFLVTTFELKERYILDGLVRQDRSSLFGADERSQIYHRISGAWRVTKDIDIPHVDELKLRASHGTAGLRPPFAAQYEVFSVVGGQPTKAVAGNSKLKPAFSRENEYGFNLNFLQNYSFDYSYSQKKTSDQMLRVPVSATTGYRFQWQNVGTIEGRSHEIALGAVLFSSQDRLWRVTVTGDRTRQRISDLRTAPFLIGAAGVRIAKGDVFGTYSGTRWIRTRAQLEETIRTGQLPGTVDRYMVNEDGYYVADTAYHTIREAPLRFWACTASDATGQCIDFTDRVQIGDANPAFNLAANSTVQWRSLSASGTISWVKGGDIYNATRQAPFNELRDKVIDQSGKPDPGSCPSLDVDANCPYKTGRKPTTYYSTFYNNAAPNDYFVERGTYVKLRELALNWRMPASWVARLPLGEFRSLRLGVVGRNLWTLTKYSGYDPDVTGFSDIPFVNRADTFRYPAYRTMSVLLDMGY